MNKQLAAATGNIRVYRRHSEDCDKDPSYLKCGCPLWIQFQRDGKQIRESAKTRDLEKAMLLVRKVERELKGEIPTTNKINIEEAAAKWLMHRQQEGIGNVRAGIMTRRFIAFCKEIHVVSLSAVTTKNISDFKLTLKFRSGNSNSLRIALSVLGGFFRWATDFGYLQVNPYPKFNLRFAPEEITPPTTEEISRVLEAAKDVRLFANLMRWSGMAIRDAVSLKRSALVSNLITSRRTKTDNPFRVRIPMWLAKELHALPPKNATYFFWDGSTRPNIIIGEYRRALVKAFKAAEVKMTSHGFRHFFISSTLATGRSVEDVSLLVGTSPTEIRKTYRHYIKEAIDRLDREQEQAWLAQGLDREGNPA
jgi:integrase